MTDRAAFERGYSDERAGKRFLDNPYVQDSDDFRIWIDGYVKSMQDRRQEQTP
jgi:ribosome modulation factor